MVNDINQQRYRRRSVDAPAANTPPVVDSVVIDQILTGDERDAVGDRHGARRGRQPAHLLLPVDTQRHGYRRRHGVPTLDMSLAGRGDKGDLIRVRVTANDGAANSPP